MAVSYHPETIAIGKTGVVRDRTFGPPSGEYTIYYDYVEDGQLKGGMITKVEPMVSPETQLEAAAVWPVTTIMDNGPPSNRIDIVVLGDGYTIQELSSYAPHAENIAADFFAEEPFAAYSSFFNIHRVDVVSNESGVDEPDNNIYRDTALDMTYNCNDTPRLLCVNSSKAWSAAGSAPDIELIWVLANSTRYGGAGYPDLATAAGNNSSSAELMLHESGHSFGKLADEYYYSDGSTYSGSEPAKSNISIYDASEQLAMQAKWYRWLDLVDVGTYEGAKYKQYGIYRPTFNSKMRNLSRPFEEVNVEQLVINFYKLVAPIDDATGPSSKPLKNDTVLFVTPMQPTDHTLDVQWSVDGVDVPGATGVTFIPNSLPEGIHDVAVRVVDNTPRVRDESARATWMTETRQWQVERWTDLSGDCFTNFVDFGVFARRWLASNCSGPEWCDGADYETDFDVDFADLRKLVDQWLLCKCEPCIWHESPEVVITTPETGSAFDYFNTDEILIEADARGIYSVAVLVEFYANGAKIGEDRNGSDGWKMRWKNFMPSRYGLWARVTDNLGAKTKSETVVIWVGLM